MESDALVSKAEALQESQNAVKDGQRRQISRLKEYVEMGTKLKEANRYRDCGKGL